MTPAQRTALTTIAEAAAAIEKKHGLPADICTAQSILESGWLQHARGNNCKGIKAQPADIPDRAQLWQTREWFNAVERLRFLASGQERRIVRETGKANGDRREYFVMDWFRRYDSLTECFEHWATIMLRLPWFSGAVSQYRIDKDSNRFLTTIAPRYATDPQYVTSIRRILGMQQVQAAIAAARAKEAQKNG